MGSERPTQSPSQPTPAKGNGQGPSGGEISSQLSAEERVSTSVTSVAMAPQMPGTARLDRRSAAPPVATPSMLEGLTDAEVMLRVRAGD